MSSPHWDSENEERRIFIANWIKEILEENKLLKGLTNKNFKYRLIKSLDFTKKGGLTQKEIDMSFYFYGLTNNNKKDFIDNISKRTIKDTIEKKIDDYSKKTFKKKESGKSYNVATTYVYGIINEKKVKCRIEKYLIRGKIQIRLRNNKGQFAKTIK